MTGTSVRVVHVAKTLGPGGTQKPIEVFVENLDEQFDTSVIGIHQGGIRGEYLRERGHDVTVLGSPSGLREALRAADPDVVHLHGSGLTDETIRTLKSVDLPAVVMTDNFGWPNRSGVEGLVDRYYFNSDMARLRYFRLFDVEGSDANLRKYQRMYYPLSRADLEREPNPVFRKRFDLDSETPVVGRISRQEANAKWSNVSIDAFERIVERRPETVLLLVNPVDDMKEVLEERGIADRCRYVDFIHPREVYAFYDSIDVLGHSSRIGESFGYVVAEALSRGTPAVVNSTPMRDNAQIELVDHGWTGYVANSSRAFAAAILDLLDDDDKCRRFGERARESAARNFGPELVTRELEAEYLRLIGERDNERPLSEVAMAPVEAKYRHRLEEYYGRPSLKYRMERAAWKGVSSLPAWRYQAYHLVRYNSLP